MNGKCTVTSRFFFQDLLDRAPKRKKKANRQIVLAVVVAHLKVLCGTQEIFWGRVVLVQGCKEVGGENTPCILVDDTFFLKVWLNADVKMRRVSVGFLQECDMLPTFEWCVYMLHAILIGSQLERKIP